jgi:hypothetical protein
MATKGLLLAMMEPTAEIEQSFQDWYDFEHVPERVAIPGFETAHRFVCLRGWPRYVALYDLTTAAVLESEAYRKIRDRPPHHTRDQVLGRYRFCGHQLHPGDFNFGDQGAAARLVILRFRHAPVIEEPNIKRGLLDNFSDRIGVCQSRLFRSTGDSSIDYIATVECHESACMKPVNPDLFKSASKYMDVENIYTPYWRVG